MKQWYYAKNSEQMGPVIEDDLITLLQNNEISPDSLVWSEGMPDWVSAKDVGLVYAPPAEGFHHSESTPPDLNNAPVPQKPHQTENSPPNATNAPVSEETARIIASIDGESSGGLGRGAYFGWSMLSGILYSLAPPEISPIMVIPVLFLGGMRYKNIGYSSWLILLAFIPLVNLIVGFQCLALPPGYAQTKQSDLTMKIVSGIYILFILLIVFAIIFPLLSG